MMTTAIATISPMNLELQRVQIQSICFYRPRSEGYVFTGVCHSICSTGRGGGGWHQMHHGIGHMVTGAGGGGQSSTTSPRTGPTTPPWTGTTTPPDRDHPPWIGTTTTTPWTGTTIHPPAYIQEPRSISGRYTSYWNVFLLAYIFT